MGKGHQDFKDRDFQGGPFYERKKVSAQLKTMMEPVGNFLVLEKKVESPTQSWKLRELKRPQTDLCGNYWARIAFQLLHVAIER